MTIFATPRLTFRSFEFEDLDALAAIVADQAVMRFVGDGTPLDIEQARRWIDKSRANVDAFGYGTGAVVERSTDTLIGWAGIARPEGEPEEMIYGLRAASWGAGLGSELLDGLVTWSRDVLRLTELRATVDAGNTVSGHMLQQRGFTLRDEQYGGEPDLHLYVLQLHNPSD